MARALSLNCRSSKAILLPLRFKEVLHQLATFLFQDATDDGGFGMHGMRREVVVAPFVVGTAIYDARQLGPSDGTCTHHAGFYGDVEGAVGKILAAQGVGSGGDGLHLGMCRHVAERLSEVVGTGDDTVFAYDNGTDGNLACLIGCLGFIEGHPHIAFVFFLLFFCNHVAKLHFFS